MPKLAAFPKGFFDAIIARRMTVFEWIDLAGRLELDGAELGPKFLDSFESGYLARVRAAAAARGLELPMLCHSPDFTQPDPSARRREVELAKDLFRVTAELGGKYCRVLSGQNRPGLDEGEALRWVIDCLWELEPHAKAAGVLMCMENHYKDNLWTYPEFAQSHRRYLAILDAVDSPWLKAQYDPSNAIVAGEDQYELLERVLPRVATMQASDRYLEGGTIDDLRDRARDPEHGYARIVKHGVIGNGLNDYDRIFSTLARSGYSGWVSIEDGEGPTVEIGMDNLRRSARFLRGQFDKHWGRRAP
ncbi:MAG TPA: sugar phosphate isomerase/epimerase family protein [Planctomycetota bacterium]|nr:sugar phosphate isomerase/epimerase family protein [Planctomycetota bacterium]